IWGQMQMGCRLFAAPISKQKKEEIMPLIHVVLVLIVVGVLLGLVNSYIPMAGSIKSILNAVVVIAVVLWLLSVFGVIGELSKIRIGK
ncbi:MAG: Thivi_2564 family membrane protein, partial [Desulfobaccales bacterium]